jgi:hypothetical protein
MRLLSLRLAGPALLCAAVASPCWAESFASSASSAGSASLGSISDSIGNSSRSSTRNTNTADGDYRVIDVAELGDRPGMLQLTLQATAVQDGEPREFVLKLPRQALEPRGIAAGDVINVRNRDYGLEFARSNAANAREAFFLVLNDDWHRELDPHAVSL